VTKLLRTHISLKLDGANISTTGAAIATCPDRVNQFIMANSTLNRLATTGPGAIGTGSPNRLLFMASIPTTDNFNPIDNHRFFVWQQYGDFFPEVTNPDDDTTIPQDHLIPASPDEAGLDWWTSEITGHGHCTAGVNTKSERPKAWRWTELIFTKWNSFNPARNGSPSSAMRPLLEYRFTLQP
jgi:hypothetical protein